MAWTHGILDTKPEALLLRALPDSCMVALVHWGDGPSGASVPVCAALVLWPGGDVRIAICSDIHDNIWKLADALPGMSDADLLIFCGDFCAPFTLTQLAEGFRRPIHAVLGNNDGDPLRLSAVAAAAGNVSLYGELAELDLDGFRVAVNHFPAIAAGLAGSGRYDLVSCGHDHTPRVGRVGETWLVNPGEVMGRFGRSTYLLFDTDSAAVSVCDV